jgi:hypothetical protein
MALTEVNMGFQDFYGGKGYGSLKTVAAVDASKATTFVGALAVHCDAKPFLVKIASKTPLTPSPVSGSEVEYSASLTFEDVLHGKNYVIPLIGVKKTALEMGADNVPRHVLPAVRTDIQGALAAFLGQDVSTLIFLRDYIAGRNSRR